MTARRSSPTTLVTLFILLAGGLALLTQFRMPVASAGRLGTTDASVIASRYLPPPEAQTTEPDPQPASPPHTPRVNPCPDANRSLPSQYSVVVRQRDHATTFEITLVRVDARSRPSRAFRVSS